MPKLLALKSFIPMTLLVLVGILPLAFQDCSNSQFSVDSSSDVGSQSSPGPGGSCGTGLTLASDGSCQCQLSDGTFLAVGAQQSTLNGCTRTNLTCSATGLQTQSVNTCQVGNPSCTFVPSDRCTYSYSSDSTDSSQFITSLLLTGPTSKKIYKFCGTSTCAVPVTLSCDANGQLTNLPGTPQCPPNPTPTCNLSIIDSSHNATSANFQLGDVQAQYGASVTGKKLYLSNSGACTVPDLSCVAPASGMGIVTTSAQSTIVTAVYNYCQTVAPTKQSCRIVRHGFSNNAINTSADLVTIADQNSAVEEYTLNPNPVQCDLEYYACDNGLLYRKDPSSNKLVYLDPNSTDPAHPAAAGYYEMYDYCNCSFPPNIVNAGSPITAVNLPQATATQSCLSQTRTCDQLGHLSGDYIYPAPCKPYQGPTTCPDGTPINQFKQLGAGPGPNYSVDGCTYPIRTQFCNSDATLSPTIAYSGTPTCPVKQCSDGTPINTYNTQGGPGTDSNGCTYPSSKRYCDANGILGPIQLTGTPTCPITKCSDGTPINTFNTNVGPGTDSNGCTYPSSKRYCDANGILGPIQLTGTPTCPITKCSDGTPINTFNTNVGPGTDSNGCTYPSSKRYCDANGILGPIQLTGTPTCPITKCSDGTPINTFNTNVGPGTDSNGCTYPSSKRYCDANGVLGPVQLTGSPTCPAHPVTTCSDGTPINSDKNLGSGINPADQCTYATRTEHCDSSGNLAPIVYGLPKTNCPSPSVCILKTPIITNRVGCEIEPIGEPAPVPGIPNGHALGMAYGEVIDLEWQGNCHGDVEFVCRGGPAPAQGCPPGESNTPLCGSGGSPIPGVAP